MTTLNIIDELEALLDGSWNEASDEASYEVYEIQMGQPKGGSGTQYGYC
ncbi:hypothetical protein [Streptomyces sp. AK02-01A]|nr:hypothetical protein [Streptomyces sp. AK02-01A]MDX3850975.1 hypothetical protein [Streptomyces sp. AK02-01A]